MTERRYVAVGLAGLFGLCLITLGCVRSDESPPQGRPSQGTESTPTGESPVPTSQDLAIEFRSEPDPPKAGDNTFAVTVKEPNGAPVTDATVTAVFSMPAMPSMNMPAMRSTATLGHEAAGRYRGTGSLSMGGTWNVTVTVSRGSQEFATRKFSLVAN